MPESPRWLVMQGRLGDAKKILDKVCDDPSESNQRLSDIKNAAGIDENCHDDVVTVEKRKDQSEATIWRELILKPTPAVRRMLIAGVGVHFFEHATGMEAVILYGPRIFKKAGVTSRSRLLKATIGVGIIKFVFITISTFIIDKVGRRKLLLVSISGMILSLAGLGTCLTMVDHSEKKLLWALVLSLIFVYTYIMFFNIGLCPVCWVYSAEIFPTKLRAAGASLGVAVNRLMNATVSMSFLSMASAMTFGGVFYFFMSITVVAWLFVFYCLPETKGRSLEEMEELFSKTGNFAKRHANVEMVDR